uniref:Uncharacterized protein n=1 Tax=Panagrolaimus sp. ES5 TaxID=591445 RepID=A0AC34FIV1_9BILA
MGKRKKNSEQEETVENEGNKEPRKKRTMQKKREIINENGEEISDIEKHYVTAVRVKVDGKLFFVAKLQ